MPLRKSDGALEVGRSSYTNALHGSLESRGWWKGIHDELVSIVSKPQFIHQLTKGILHLAYMGLKSSINFEADSNLPKFDDGVRRLKRMAVSSVKEAKKKVPYRSGEFSRGENKVTRTASSTFSVQRKRRRTPLREIQDVINTSLEIDEAVDSKFGIRCGEFAFESYGYPLKECFVVLDDFCGKRRRLDPSESDIPVKAADEADSDQTKDEGNSNSEQTKQNITTESNEAAEAAAAAAENGTNSSGVTSEQVSTQESDAGTKFEFGERKADCHEASKLAPESFDDEPINNFNEVFATRQEVESFDSDTEEFWAKRKKFWSEIDYQKEARELLGLDADFSTPAEAQATRSPEGGNADVNSTAQACRKNHRSSSSNSSGSRNNGDSRNSALLNKTPVARTLKKVPKWQVAKQLDVKISRSGRTIRPPIDDRFV